MMAIGAFVAGSFVASPELRAYASTIANDVICTGCVGTSDLAGSAVTIAKLANGAVNSAKIADNSITAADLAPDSVGASELQGVTKLLFAKCNADSSAGNGGSQGANIGVFCNIVGVDAGDNAVALVKGGKNPCFVPQAASPGAGKVEVRLTNVCPFVTSWASGDTISIMVYDK